MPVRRVTTFTWLTAGYWLTAFAALWLLLAGNAGWYLGCPTIVAATVLAVRLRLAPLALRLFALPQFIGTFLLATAAGGWDVARRALHPRLPIAPAWVRYRVHSQHPQVRMLLSSLVGLLPGTLATGMHGDQLNLHVLDEHSDWHSSVASLERALCRLFGAEQS